MQGFLNINVSPWLRVFITRSIAIVPAVIVAVSATSNLNSLDELLNVVQSLQLPFALLPLLLFSANVDIMSEFAIGRGTKLFAWPTFFSVLAINVYLVQDFASRKIDTTPGTVIGIVLFAAVYFGSLIYMIYFYWVAKPRLSMSIGDSSSSATASPVHSARLHAGEPDESTPMNARALA